MPKLAAALFTTLSKTSLTATDFRLTFPMLEIAIQRANFSITHLSIFGVVAESDGQIIGSNFLDERDPIRGLGPVTVDPSAQVHG